MFCKEEDEKERQSSFLSLFMKVDRLFYDEMLWSDAGAWDLSGTDTGSGACVRKGWPESAGNCKDPAYQAAYGKCIDTETGESRLSL
mgnify:CR=1 FL=1